MGKTEELKPADAQMVYLGKETDTREKVKTIVDKARMWKGRMIYILMVEHQSYVDYRMVLRNMLSESLNYHKQWKQKKSVHNSVKDLKIGTEEFVTNYKLNLYDCHAHDTFEEYQTGLSQLFETMRYCGNKKQLQVNWTRIWQK